MTSRNYLLLTPGPLTTSRTVKEAMLFDSCTWDDDYNLGVVEQVRRQLTALATAEAGYTSVLLQGSGSYAVEAVLGSVIGQHGKVLIVSNGAYGARMAEMAERMGIAHHVYDCGEVASPDPHAVEAILKDDGAITHIAMVHCETTTGILNPIAALGALARRYGKTYIVDAMSSFGGIPLDVAALGIDFLISSANKCIQGVPGFAFVIAREEQLALCAGRSRSLSLDLYAQWVCMRDNHGKWRFTSPTHTVLAFAQALKELAEEGGIAARYRRYRDSQRQLVAGMQRLGFTPLLEAALHSPIITAFYSPTHPQYRFDDFYTRLKAQGFVIYPGKVSQSDCFRIGNIGEVYAADITALLNAIDNAMYWHK
ncbi:MULTISPECIES: 2-aminoethylphosphonate--pyruvate transaminase [Edwardsiella]|uniref:2-aminoethylphosphonate--pyruvate transaminase n=2 Tax=Edwardsiella anguillarum TaxID=1821960 RepID=A0A076LMP7_9GAMM|nr:MULTISPECIES: 2-aminoethylphosphonate--pyruvate transaminase [Edwardsiella]AKM48587.1 2-aminoethylphosphonate--pyruvate aminotransferase [Edwardsiella sp. EA181011]GAJ67859.1 2-aminoethylphosphonate--pyruvate transaminase [Edwardsiella piscicida]AIJ09161.1 2-aminoethylphosphonate:pyruvate aminotransferase [Edwardsiella anguillarum ET080813]AKR77091.1 2-aminoethylphosphonate--pyruvate transaminase [Edwardsiella sp. LADL05-105]KAB0589989.1 2-aminoethylphosphonate--pyruvate transaminase [Edwar